MGEMERLVRLKTLLFERKITQSELSKQVGISKSQISMFILGRMIPYPEEKEKIAKALGTSINDIFNR